MDKLKNKSIEELQDHIDIQFKTLSSANNRIKELESEVVSLRRQNDVLSEFNSRKMPKIKTNDQLLCEAEITKLYDISKERPLELKETKQLDIYVKSLYLIKGKNMEESSKPKDVENEVIDENDLIKYAQLPE